MPDIGDLLWKIQQGLKAKGYGEMDDATLQEASKQLRNPQVQQALYGGQLSVEQIVEQVDQAIQASQSRPGIASAVPTQMMR